MATPQDQWAEITRKRMEMIEAEKEKAKQRKDIEKETDARQRGEFLKETQESKERSEGREEWRQDQHAQKLEAEEKRRQEEKSRLEREAREKKKKEREAEEQKKLAELHKHAIEKRVETKLANAENEEEKQKKQASIIEERTVQVIDQEVKRKIEHIEREAKKKKERLQADADKKRVDAEETFKQKKTVAQKLSSEKMRGQKDEALKRDIRLEENRQVTEADNERKRMLSGLDESLAQQLFDIDTQAKRLIDEVKREEALRSNRAHGEADRKKKDAAARRESTEKWFNKSSGKDGEKL